MRQLEIAAFLLGPDLSFDRSVRSSLGDLTEPKGEILFSPMVFKA